MRTNENYLRWQLGRWAKRDAPNVTMLDDGAPADVPLEPGEHAIASIALATGGASLVITDSRLIQGARNVLRYTDVRHCYWVDRDREVAARLKHSRPHRLIFELNDHPEVILDGLGHAVFPLLKFFWFKLGRREPTAG